MRRQDEATPITTAQRSWRRLALLTIVGIVLVALIGVSYSAIRGANGEQRLHIAATHTTTASQSSPFGPLVSRGKPVKCSPSDVSAGGPNAITSGRYGDYSFWRARLSTLPSWCAIDVGQGPTHLMVVWSSDYIFDYIAANGMTPRDYTLAVSSDSTDGANGHWRVVASVTDNETRVRESVIPFAGMSWVKMTVTRGQSGATQPYVTIDQIDCYDVSTSLHDTALFEGDSITVMGLNRFTGTHPTFDELMHTYDSRLFPTMLNEGLGGWTSGGAVTQIDTWLALNPDINYWLLGWGTNDALNLVSPAVFHDNMQRLIDAIKAAGHIPVLAKIPAVNLPSDQSARVNAEIQALNQQIDTLTQANHLIPGPDLYTLFSQHKSQYLLSDGIHPSIAGSRAMNHAWYLAMREELRAKAA